MKGRALLYAPVVMLLASLFALGQTPQSGQTTGSTTPAGQRGRGGRGAPVRPTPRRADGKVSLGPLSGEAGIWIPGAGGAERMIEPEPGDPVLTQFPLPPGQQDTGRIKVSDIPFQPWAKELYDGRRANQFEPHTRCKPSGGPRQFLTPYGVEFVDIPELQRIFVMDIGGPHTYRIIYMDGRSHPKDLASSYYGHSIGRWEGDTLIVDTSGFNENFWIDRTGLPHSDRLHMIERFTRTEYNTIRYEVSIDDPGAYTSTWNSGFFLRWQPGQELFEYICQENNFASELMVGGETAVDRTSHIVP